MAADDVKVALPELTGSGEDSTLTSHIAIAEPALARHLRFPATSAGTFALEDSTYVVYLDGPRRLRPEELLLPVRPVVSITSIYDDPDRAYGASTLVDSGDYELDAQRGVVVIKTTATHGSWYTAYRTIKATLVGGWETAPDDLVLAIALQVKHQLKVLRIDPEAFTATLQGRSQTRRPTAAISPEARQLLGGMTLYERAVA